MKRSILTDRYEDIAENLRLEKPYQAKIIYHALINGVTEFGKMTSLPKLLRERLSEEHGSLLSSKVVNRSEADSAVKLALLLQDGSIIECVRLSDGKGRYTACLSSQVGCAMGCAFCSTGTMGFIRNLDASEIAEQFLQLTLLGEPITHIVFMGMGEALQNFTAAMDAIKALHREDGFNISYRRMTISTSGYVPGIRRLSELSIPVRLAVSLVSADDSTRSEIMRINRTYPLSELKSALISFQHHQDKRITLEYCMLGGINTDRESADKLKSFMKGLDAIVNLIPWNPVEGMGFRAPSGKEIQHFESELKSRAINYTIRRSKGQNIAGACGQLATETRRKSRNGS